MEIYLRIAGTVRSLSELEREVQQKGGAWLRQQLRLVREAAPHGAPEFDITLPNGWVIVGHIEDRFEDLSPMEAVGEVISRPGDGQENTQLDEDTCWDRYGTRDISWRVEDGRVIAKVWDGFVGHAAQWVDVGPFAE